MAHTYHSGRFFAKVFFIVLLFSFLLPASAQAQKKVAISGTSGYGELKIGTPPPLNLVAGGRQINGDVVKINTRKKASSGIAYALIIGVKNYQHPSINNLEFPISDATKVKNVLTQHYSFAAENVILLQNPTKEEITAQLDRYIDNITANDKLLVFYAGHGYWDKKFGEGYWFAADARKGSRSSWLPNSTLRNYLRAIPAKHTLLISDACFSGSIFKERKAFAEEKAINALEQYPSRKAMTSGAMRIVPDKSVFTKYFVKRLTQNTKKYLPAEQLFASFKMAVINNSPNSQKPQYGVIREAGDEGGDFVFVRK